MGRRKPLANSQPRSPPPKPSVPPLEIPEGEQRRLVWESKVLDQLPQHPLPKLEDDEDNIPIGDEIFNTILLAVPFSFLLLLMNVLIHQQYNQEPTFGALADRMIPSIPILSLFIFYTTRYKHLRIMRSFFFLLSLIVGPRLIWVVNRGSWLVNMKQSPPLATVWVYAVFQLDLVPALVSLGLINAWYFWQRDYQHAF